MTDNIRILTTREIEKLRNFDKSIPVYGTFEDAIGPQISLGSGNKDEIRTIQTLNHETIHETLTELFGRGLSFSFDRDLFYNFEYCKNGELSENTRIRETLIAFFTLSEDESPLV